MKEALVRVENLSHRYTIQWAVKDISFEIPENGIYGLLGSNGAGKSTTMNIMSGVLKQSKGNVYINGINMAKDAIAAKKQIGFLPQKPPLYTDTTVEEYLTNCARLRQIPANKVKSAVDEVLEKCAIAHFRKRLLKNLSGGYQQRVGIAQAIIHKPAFIILDEPTNGLDPNQIVEIRGLIKEIAEERAVLLSTHILTEVHAICDYIYMIENGKLVFSGKTDEFDSYLKPNTIFVRLLDMPGVSDLMSVEGIENVEELGGPEYRLIFSDLNGAAERVVQASVKNNWRLEEIHAEKNSLNEVFSVLSNKNKHTHNSSEYK
jgi:ABC-2 type transport system ATP-binding protein